MKIIGRLVVTIAAALTVPAQAQVVGLGTNPQGTLTYTMGIALAKVVADKTNLQMRVQPIGGTSQLMPQIDRGEIEFGMFSAIDMTDGFEGRGSYPGKPVQSLRAVAVLGSIYYSFFVRNDSPARSVADTKGMRVPSEFPAALVVLRSTKALMASAGYSYADYIAQPVANLQQAGTEFRNGRVDLGTLPVGAAVVREINQEVAGGVRYLGISDAPDAVARMKKEVEVTYLAKLEPAPHLVGIREPITIMAFDVYLATSAAVNPELVEKVVAALYDSREALIAAFSGYRDFRPSEMAKVFPVPFHPGAITAYTAKGVWPPKGR